MNRCSERETLFKRGEGCLRATFLKETQSGVKPSNTKMIPASTYLPSTNSKMVAASNIQGIGLQNLASARSKGFSAVSGMEFGPDVSSR